METNYTDQQVFVDALYDHDFKTVLQCLKAGQSLHDATWEYGTVFSEACQNCNDSGVEEDDPRAFQACIALGKPHLDINATDQFGCHCLTWCNSLWSINVCLQMGADVNYTWRFEGRVYNAFTWHCSSGTVLFNNSHPQNNRNNLHFRNYS